MPSTSFSSSYTLPRSSSYVPTSRYINYSTGLPPLPSKYSPSRYSTISSTTKYSDRPSYLSTTTTNNRYSNVYSTSTGTTSWKSRNISPSLERKSISSNSNYVARRPSFSDGLGYRSSSISSLTSASPSDAYRPSVRSSSYDPLSADEKRWTSRNSSSVTSTTSLPLTTYSSSHHSRSSGSAEDSKLAGKVGLHNLGNTCFMNAVLQCLCHTKPLVEYCKRGTFSGDVNHRSPTGGDLIKAFASLIKALWNDNNNSVSPDCLKKELQKCAPRFSGYSQQDAQELLRYLLQGLHDDINRGTSKPRYRASIKEHSSDYQRATDSWQMYQDTDNSKIVDLFAGQLKSSLKCSDCGHTSVTFDPFWDLSLPIPEGCQRTNLQQCLRLFSSPETLDGSEKPFCEICKTKTRSTKQLQINIFPHILVIHLKRFASGINYRNKLNVTVECCQNNLDLSSFASSNCQNSLASYNLFGVVDHSGTTASGHYTAKCRHPYTSEWNEFNDSRVLDVSSTANIITSKAYLLFYEQASGGKRGSRL